MKFLYCGILEDGQQTKNVLEAKDRKQALDILKRQNICVLKLHEKADSRRLWPRYEREQSVRLSLEEALRFFEKLFSLLSAKLTLTESIESMFKNSSNANEKRLLKNVLQELKEGVGLSKALNKFCNSLPINILCILDIGDVTGDLGSAVSNVVKILRRKIELKKHLISGLSYPLLVCVISLGVIGLFIFYLVPHVEIMMTNLGGKLPRSTYFLIFCSRFMINYSWAILLVFALCAFWIKLLCKRLRVRIWMDKNVLRLPLIGSLKLLYLRVNITNMLAGLLASRIDISQAMTMPVESIDNLFIRQKYIDAQTAILDGVSVSQALQTFGIIDGSVCDILAVGEKTGNLDDAFVNVATIYEKHLDKFLKKLVVCTSTIALLFAFSLVTILALSVVSSVLNFSSGLSR